LDGSFGQFLGRSLDGPSATVALTAAPRQSVGRSLGRRPLCDVPRAGPRTVAWTGPRTTLKPYGIPFRGAVKVRARTRVSGTEHCEGAFQGPFKEALQVTVHSALQVAAKGALHWPVLQAPRTARGAVEEATQRRRALTRRLIKDRARRLARARGLLGVLARAGRLARTRVSKPSPAFPPGPSGDLHLSERREGPCQGPSNGPSQETARGGTMHLTRGLHKRLCERYPRKRP
jgi:hypothetical protein